MSKEKYSLRPAQKHDARFLFNTIDEAMRPVSTATNPGKRLDEDARFEKYMESFEPEKVQVIQYNGKDVGRLRIVRSSESIYVGGIQILSEFQGKQIGSAIFESLIDESKLTRIPILLEVHIVNTRAIRFYEAHGFREIERGVKQIIMQHTPDSS